MRRVLVVTFSNGDRSLMQKGFGKKWGKYWAHIIAHEVFLDSGMTKLRNPNQLSELGYLSLCPASRLRAGFITAIG